MSKESKDLRFEMYIARLVEEEAENALLEEGVVDWLKKGVQAASAAWDKVKDRMKSAVANMAQTLTAKAQQANKAYSSAIKDYKAIKAIEAQSGEKFPVNNVMAIAQQLPNEAKAAIAETAKEKQAVVNAAPKVAQQTNVRQAPAQQQQAKEAYINFTAELLETTNKRYKFQNKKLIKETRQLQELDPFGGAGIALGLVGGVPLLIKGLYKLAKFFKLGKTADFFEKAYHVAHHVEEKVVDYVIPDRLSYNVYKGWYAAVVKQQDQAVMSFEEYKKSKIRKQVERKVYVALLLPFLIHGINGVAHAGVSLLGASEAAASTVKAVEIGQEVIEVAASVASAGSKA